MDDFKAYVGKEEYIDGDYGILIPNLDTEKNLDASLITPEEERLAQQMMRLLDSTILYEKYKKASLERLPVSQMRLMPGSCVKWRRKCNGD